MYENMKMGENVVAQHHIADVVDVDGCGCCRIC